MANEEDNTTKSPRQKALEALHAQAKDLVELVEARIADPAYSGSDGCRLAGEDVLKIANVVEIAFTALLSESDEVVNAVVLRTPKSGTKSKKSTKSQVRMEAVLRRGLMTLGFADDDDGAKKIKRRNLRHNKSDHKNYNPEETNDGECDCNFRRLADFVVSYVAQAEEPDREVEFDFAIPPHPDRLWFTPEIRAEIQEARHAARLAHSRPLTLEEDAEEGGEVTLKVRERHAEKYKEMAGKYRRALTPVVQRLMVEDGAVEIIGDKKGLSETKSKLSRSGPPAMARSLLDRWGKSTREPSQ